MLEHALSVIPNISRCAKPSKRIIVRIDINSPIKNNKILDDYRLKAHAKTISILSDAGARVVVLAHQGRPGQDDFTSLEIHKNILEKYVNKTILFIEDIIGPYALNKIDNMKDGEILMLENVRMLSEEVVEGPPEKQANTWLVRKLAPHADYFVFDGFAVAHRSQPSVVGFPMVMPSCMGYVMERELTALSEIWRNRKLTLIVVGGAKVPESLRAIKEVLDKGLADKVLVGGLVSVVMASAKSRVGPSVRQFLEGMGLLSEVEKARMLLETYGDFIVLPEDFRSRTGELSLSNLDEVPGDIGNATAAKFAEIINDYEYVVVTGPMGKIEEPDFFAGTRRVLEAASRRKAIIGGGHTILSAEKAGVLDKIFHVSTGGRAFLMALSEELPAVNALVKSAEKFWL
ncbi:Phosphoglycerate kinase [Thermoproteus uzoniensis 768-20]|uniref:Phosphoglycerate kinase n=1 Tax=Thermoproteus uzoniensis (strain 768-20) TaxID=999630 RepID=F2L4V6_THEU7|nr:phosphoglycerate kinase [Thermoproteus uzoniensis]AEA13460.1 Phosphoglycerate kinase [Thermoproteus uzoniensis 768-20]